MGEIKKGQCVLYESPLSEWKRDVESVLFSFHLGVKRKAYNLHCLMVQHLHCKLYCLY